MTWPERFVATNLYFDFERYAYARATFLIDETYGAVIAKIDNAGLWRCTYMEDAGLPEALLMERLKIVYAAIVPAPTTASSVPRPTGCTSARRRAIA